MNAEKLAEEIGKPYVDPAMPYVRSVRPFVPPVLIGIIAVMIPSHSRAFAAVLRPRIRQVREWARTLKWGRAGPPASGFLRLRHPAHPHSASLAGLLVLYCYFLGACGSRGGSTVGVSGLRWDSPLPFLADGAEQNPAHVLHCPNPAAAANCFGYWHATPRRALHAASLALMQRRR